MLPALNDCVKTKGFRIGFLVNAPVNAPHYTTPGRFTMHDATTPAADNSAAQVKPTLQERADGTAYIEVNPALDARRALDIAADLMPLLDMNTLDGYAVLHQFSDEQIADKLSCLVVGSATMEALAERLAQFWHTQRGMMLQVDEGDEDEDEDEDGATKLAAAVDRTMTRGLIQ